MRAPLAFGLGLGLRSPFDPRRLTDIVRAIFGDGTPGVSYSLEQALRANDAAGVTGTSGPWTPEQLSRCQAFQDNVGTLPVTAMEQPLGLLLDASRGLVRGVELVPQSVSLNGNTDHGGGSYTVINGNLQVRFMYQLASLVQGSWYEADIRFEAITGPANIVADWCDGLSANFVPTAGATYKLKFQPRSAGYDATYRFLDVLVTGTSASARFRVVGFRELPGAHLSQPSNTPSRPIVSRRVNLLTNTAVLATQNVTTLAAAHTLSFAGPGTVTLSGTATGTYSAGTHAVSCTAGTLTATVAGSVLTADLRLTQDVPGLPSYQRVTTATDYDTAGFPAYALFDGLDDWLETAPIDYTGTDEMTVVGGLLEGGSSQWARFCELSTNAESVNGSVLLGRHTNPSDGYLYGTRGTAISMVVGFGHPHQAPHKAVVTGQSKISTDTATLRVNGVQVATSTSDQGTGNYGLHKLYVGRRAGTSLPFKGRFYSLHMPGKLLTANQLLALESKVSREMKL